MRHVLVRTLLGAALAGLSLVGVGVGSAAATQTPPGPDLGWLRLQPANGTVDDAVDGLSQAKCPQGEAIIVQMTGPGIPTTGDVGYLVGNTALTALPPTASGQMWVPMSLTFRDWFGRNTPGFTPVGTYTLTLICRDALKSSLSFGHFAAQVTITKSGTYKALGTAAVPFNTTKGEKDPLAAVTTSPNAATGAPSGGSTAAPAASGGAAGGTSPSPNASVTSAPGTTAASSQPGESGSGVRVILLAIGALLLAGAGAIAVRSRQGSLVEPTPGRHGADAH